MIFVTVGTTKFPFDRLLESVDKAMIDVDSQEKLVIQKGISKYKFKYKNTEVFKELAFNRMIDIVKKARVIITHGGPATVFLSLKYGKNKPLVIPRLKKFDEHVDNHQLFFANFLRRKKFGEVITRKNGMQNAIKQYLLKPQKRGSGEVKLREKIRLIRNLLIFTSNLNKNE